MSDLLHVPKPADGENVAALPPCSHCGTMKGEPTGPPFTVCADVRHVAAPQPGDVIVLTEPCPECGRHPIDIDLDIWHGCHFCADLGGDEVGFGVITEATPTDDLLTDWRMEYVPDAVPGGTVIRWDELRRYLVGPGIPGMPVSLPCVAESTDGRYWFVRNHGDEMIPLPPLGPTERTDP